MHKKQRIKTIQNLDESIYGTLEDLADHTLAMDFDELYYKPIGTYAFEDNYYFDEYICQCEESNNFGESIDSYEYCDQYIDSY